LFVLALDLIRFEVQKMKKLNDGSAIYSKKIKVKKGTPFIKELEIGENDVLLITITEQ